MLRPSRRRHHHGQGNDCDRVTGDLRGARREPQARARRSRSGIDRRTARRAAHGAENLTIPKTASARLVTTFSMTAYLGGASPVLQVRDSRLRWGVDTERGWVNVGGGGYVQRVLAGYRYRAYPTPGQAAMLARTFGCARVVFNDALAPGRTRTLPVRRSATPKYNAGSSPSQRPPRRGSGWVRSPQLRSCRPVRTRGGHTGTGSTPCPVDAKAARSGTPGSGPAKTTGPGSD